MKSVAALRARLESRIDAMQARERVILLAAGILLMLFFWFQLWGSPLWSKSEALFKQARNMEQQQATLAETLAALEQRLAQDPNQALHGQRQQLQLEIEQQDARLRQDLARLVAPRDMAPLLELLLRQDRGLRVIQLQKMPVQPMDIAGTAGEETAPKLYRHGLRLVFEGSFLDLWRYLRRLEGLERDVLVNRLEFEVLEYPRAQVVLDVETLSLDKGWIGG